MCLHCLRGELLQVSDRVQIKSDPRHLDNSTGNIRATDGKQVPFEARASTKAGGCNERWHPEQGIRAFTFFARDEEDFRVAM